MLLSHNSLFRTSLVLFMGTDLRMPHPFHTHFVLSMPFKTYLNFPLVLNTHVEALMGVQGAAACPVSRWPQGSVDTCHPRESGRQTMGWHMGQQHAGRGCVGGKVWHVKSSVPLFCDPSWSSFFFFFFLPSPSATKSWRLNREKPACLSFVWLRKKRMSFQWGTLKKMKNLRI